MVKDEGFVEALAWPRAGDHQGIGRFVILHRRAVRGAAHGRLVALALDRFHEWEDVFHDVLRRFLKKVARGGFPRLTEQDLPKLLVRMTGHRVTDLARHHHRELRAHFVPLNDVAEEAGEPTGVEELHALLQRVLEHLTADERYVALGRMAGKSWGALARECGQSPDAVRMKLTRAGARLRKQWAVEAA